MRDGAAVRGNGAYELMRRESVHVYLAGLCANEQVCGREGEGDG